MVEERTLITVRTYPNLSQTHIETVCTGGITAQGEWRRYYPVPWRHLEDASQYKTWDVVTVKVREETSDGRPESRRPDPVTFKCVEHLNSWEARCSWVNPTIVESLAEMRERKFTLRPVRVRAVEEFIAIPSEAEWSAREQDLLRQESLFAPADPLEKVPFDFRLRWIDEGGEEHDSKFIAWEVGQTWRRWSSPQMYGADAIEQMRAKWMTDIFGDRQRVSFFMGNYRAHPMHYGVCGVFHPPKEIADADRLW